MKNKLFILLSVAIAGLCSCEPNPDYLTGTLNPTIPISEVRHLETEGTLLLDSENLSGAIQITGVVTSNSSSGNIPEGLITVQQLRREQTHGIAVEVDDDIISEVNPGDSVYVHVDGKSLSRKNGILTISKVTSADLQVLSSGHKVNPLVVTSAYLTDNSLDLECVLVRVSSCSPEGSDEGGNLSGDISVSDGTGTVNIHVQESSDFSERAIPPTASYTGVLLLDDNGVPSIWPTKSKDIDARYKVLAWDLTGEDGTALAFESTYNDSNLKTSSIVRGAGLPASKAGNTIACTAAYQDISYEQAVEHEAYLEFTITPKSGCVFSLSSIDVILRIQASGPLKYKWVGSIDGGATFLPMSDDLSFSGKTNNNNGDQQPTVEFAEIEWLQEINGALIIRLYAWGAASTSTNNCFRLKSPSEGTYALSLEGCILTETDGSDEDTGSDGGDTGGDDGNTGGEGGDTGGDDGNTGGDGEDTGGDGSFDAEHEGYPPVETDEPETES